MRPNTILAVSGGVDSVIMSHLYSEAGLPFSIAHCNFNLRGADSLKDEEFVLELGERLGARVFVKNFDTDKYATENGVSIQMAARELRYTWFKTLAEEHAAMIAIAHHANDVTETLLFNLAKSTGIAGFHGLSELDEIIIRPLLWAKKEEIEEFAKTKQYAFCEDSSNESEKYMRNIIRRKVVPELERVNPSFVEGSLRTASRIKEAEDFFKYSIENLGLIEEQEGHVLINKSGLETLPGAASVLYNLITPYGFNYDQVKSIQASLKSSGALFMSEQWVLNIDRTHLIISKIEKREVEIWIDKEQNNIKADSSSFLTKVIEKKNYKILNDNNIAALDYAKLNFPLLLRNWRKGDSFIPLGMKGKKKVSDFLIDAKVPVNLKPDQLVLVSNEEIIWLVDKRIDERYKLNSDTKTVYQINSYSE